MSEPHEVELNPDWSFASEPGFVWVTQDQHDYTCPACGHFCRTEPEFLREASSYQLACRCLKSALLYISPEKTEQIVTQ